MSTPSLESKVTAAIERVLSKLVPGKTVAVDVLITVLRQKFANDFGTGEDWEPVARRVAAALLAKRNAAAAPAPVAAAAAAPAKKPAASESSSDHDDDSASDDSDDSASDDSASSAGDDEEDYDSEEDEEGESGEEDEDSDDDGSSSATGEDASLDSKAKKHRAEERPAAAQPAAAAANSGAVPSTSELLAFAKRLKLSVRPRNPSESEEEYRNNYVLGLYKTHKLDPTQLTKEAAKLYDMRKELAYLQTEVDINLDRRSRRGRPNFEDPATLADAEAGLNASSGSKYDTGLYDDE